MTEFLCQICNAPDLVEVAEFSALPRVTSDCLPWPAGGRLSVCGRCGAIQKYPDAVWRDEIARIYAGYAIYHQAGGAEQFIYDLSGAGAAPRSVRLVDYLDSRLAFSQTGRILDVGCGNGSALRSFAARHPRWSLFGCEFDEKSLASLRQIPGFAELYTGRLADIGGRFDLLTLIHSLEHLIQPVAALKDLQPRLEPEGHIFVEVVDCAQSPYDILIADHLLHFTLDTLGLAGRLGGYDTVVLTNGVLHKELTWIGRRSSTSTPETAAPPAPSQALALARAHVGWLQRQAAAFQGLARQHGRVGIFGTSISATWLHSILGERVEFFVDEDPGRAHRTHMGRPILPPAEVAEGAQVLVPLIPDTAASVARRLARPGVSFHLPPV